MSFLKKATQTNDTKLNKEGKTTFLNPNAAEFVPFALRLSPGSTSAGNDTQWSASSGQFGKATLGRSESSVTNNSDEEARQYWSSQLPDDITPDFKGMGDEEPQEIGSLSLAGLSLHGGNETARLTASTGNGYLLNQPQELSINGDNFAEKLIYSNSSYGEDPSSANFLNVQNKPWDNELINLNSDQLIGNGRDGIPYNGNSRNGVPNDISNEPAMMDDNETNPIQFLAAHFPGFAANSLMELYFANQCDLIRTIEMLTQLELQVDGSFNQNLNSKPLSAPNLNTLEFPILSVPEEHKGLQNYGGDDLQQSANTYRSFDKDNMLMFKSSSSLPTRGSIDYASAVKKFSFRDPGVRRYDTNGSADASIGSSRSSHVNVLASSYNSGCGRSGFGDRLQFSGSTRAPPVWLETGEAVANMYSELREEASDHARLRNTCFEQARQAYLIGNKALAKELGNKGKLHNMLMKAAHEKAQESIYRQRNPISPKMQGRQERMIDLHGLHVSEAIHVLKHELNVLRAAARSADQHLLVYICVGTGHHTRGSRTPARLPVAVQRYLLEDERLEYSEPQPGLLRVVIY